jgi:glycosyltransferase involved in cell wall biosynthesis
VCPTSAGAELRSAPRFSIVILTRNEERRLPRLLDDLREFSDRGGDVVVVDSGSTDNTLAIAKRAGCRVETVNDRFDSLLDSAQAAEIERRFARAGEGPLVMAGQRLFHFGKAREYAGGLAANSFVLQIDASDEVPALDIDEFDMWIGSQGVHAFEYNQRYGNVGLRIARFYDRSQYHWEGRVHEILSTTVEPAPAPASTIRCSPKHLMVRHHKDEDKSRNYLAGLALQTLEYPQKPRWWHYLGRELFYHHRYESAIVALEVHARMENAWLTERSQSLCFIGECHEALGRVHEAKECYQRAFAMDPTRREPLLRLAAASSAQCEFDAAERWARQSLEIPPTNAYPELEGNYTWVPHCLLYWSLFWLRRRDEARVHWDAYRALVPDGSLIHEHARLFPFARVSARGPSSSRGSLSSCGAGPSPARDGLQRLSGLSESVPDSADSEPAIQASTTSLAKNRKPRARGPEGEAR